MACCHGNFLYGNHNYLLWLDNSCCIMIGQIIVTMATIYYILCKWPVAMVLITMVTILCFMLFTCIIIILDSELAQERIKTWNFILDFLHNFRNLHTLSLIHHKAQNPHDNWCENPKGTVPGAAAYILQ